MVSLAPTPSRINIGTWSLSIRSLGMVSLEAIACGRPVITYVSSEYPEYKDFPLKDVDTEEKVAEAVSNATSNLWKKTVHLFKEKS